MKALQVHSITPDFSGCALAELPMPVPGPGEVRVRIEASTIAFPDILMTRGGYQLKPDLPFVPGTDIAGTVDATGPGVRALAAGDRVAATRALGGYAQYGLYRAEALHRIPGAMPFAEAAALGSAYLTAHVALVEIGRLKAGEWLLVHGAAGGVGLAAVDLGKALGARVIAVASTPNKARAITELHAPEAVLEAGPGLRENVKQITEGSGADVVFEPVGGDAFDVSTRCIAFGGRLLVVGFASGRIATLPTNIPLIKGFSVMGVRAGEFSRRRPDAGRAAIKRLWDMAQRGVIRPHVSAAFPLSQWRAAFATMDDRAVVGRTILRPHD